MDLNFRVSKKTRCSARPKRNSEQAFAASGACSGAQSSAARDALPGFQPRPRFQTDSRSSLPRRGRVRLEIAVAVFVVCMVAWTIPPQFPQTPQQANRETAEFQLARLRAVMESYRQDHAGRAPRLDANRLRGLTEKSDSLGQVSSQGHLGPYLDSFPANPLTGSTSIRATHQTQLKPNDVRPGGGWMYNEATGQLWLDSNPGFDW